MHPRQLGAVVILVCAIAVRGGAQAAREVETSCRPILNRVDCVSRERPNPSIAGAVLTGFADALERARVNRQQAAQLEHLRRLSAEADAAAEERQIARDAARQAGERLADTEREARAREWGEADRRTEEARDVSAARLSLFLRKVVAVLYAASDTLRLPPVADSAFYRKAYGAIADLYRANPSASVAEITDAVLPARLEFAAAKEAFFDRAIDVVLANARILRLSSAQTAALWTAAGRVMIPLYERDLNTSETQLRAALVPVADSFHRALPRATTKPTAKRPPNPAGSTARRL